MIDYEELEKLAKLRDKWIISEEEFQNEKNKILKNWYNNNTNNNVWNFSNIIPVWKFIFLSIITWWIYEIYWFYKYWKFLKDKESIKVNPILRSIFSVVFFYSFIEHIRKFLNKSNIQIHDVSIWLAFLYYVFYIFIFKDDPYWLISFLSFIPILPLVRAINSYWEKEEANLPLKKFNWWQIILIIIWCLYLFIVITIVLVPKYIQF
jgi:hypothetical protein